MTEWTIHGGRLAAAARAFGGSPGDWLDLSTGINPHAWPGAGTVPFDWRALPDEAALAGLEAAAAAHFGIDADHVCALPGSEIGIRLLGTLPIDGATAHVVPAYRSHGEALTGTIPISAEDIAAAAAAGRTVLLANPNNPDGRSIGRAELRAITDSGAGWLIVDEAFADTRFEPGVAPDVTDDRRLVVLRSFGKFFGLAGLRLGFAIGPRPIVAAIRQRLGSWPVSAAAIAIGTAAYRDRDWIAAMRDRLWADGAVLDALLRRHGLSPIGDCPLFRLVVTEHAGALFERLARRHILTRPFDYAPDWLRFGLPGDAAALDRLDRALSDG